MVEISVAYVAVVYKKELFSAGPLGIFGLPNKTTQLNYIGIFFHRHQPLVIIIAKQVDDALLKCSGRQVVNFLPVVMQAKKHLRIGQGGPLEFINNVSHLHRVAL